MGTIVENPGNLAARLIVCDGGEGFIGRLQSLLRQRGLEDLLPLVIEGRSLSQSRTQFGQWPASLIWIFLPERLGDDYFAAFLSQVAELSHTFAQARIVLLITAAIEPEIEVAVREAGVAAVLDWQENDRIVSLIQRHIRSAPRRELTLKESMLARIS